MTFVVNPLEETVPNHLKTYERMKSHLESSRKIAKSCINYEKRFESRLSEAVVFASYWQNFNKDLKTTLEKLITVMDINPVSQQKLLTVLEMAERNLQLGEKVGIALKTISLCTEQSRVLIKDTQKVIDDMMDPLVIFPDLEAVDPQRACEEETLIPALAESKLREAEALAPALLFSDRARVALSALEALKVELNALQNQNDREISHPQPDQKGNRAGNS